MLITCEECNSGFQLDDSRMKEEGVKVKCSKCNNIFMAYPPSSIESSGEDATGMQGFQDEPEGNEENGLDFSEMEAMLSSEDELSLDTSSDEQSDIADSGFGFDETDELDLSDIDQLFEEDEASVAESLSIEETEGPDLELDEVQDTAPSLGSAGDTNGGIEEIEELDFLDADEEFEEEVAPLEEVEELELGLDEEKNTPVPEFEEETDFSIDGESLDIEAGMESEPAEAVEEFDISDAEMEDMFSIDEQTDDAAVKNIDEDAELSIDLEKELGVGTTSDDFENELEIGDVAEDQQPEEVEAEDIEAEDIEPEEDEDEFEELGLTDLEEMFTLDEDQEIEKTASEEADDHEVDEALELQEDYEDIDIDETDMSGVQSETGDSAETEESEEDTDEFEEFGLTDLEEMFNLEAEQKPEEPEPVLEDSNDVDYGDEYTIDGDHDELEFKLDEAIAVLDSSSEEEVGVEFEEYEELDLSELDEMFDKEEFVEKKEVSKKEELGELDFGIETIPETKEDATEFSEEEDLGISDTSELDFSDIGEMLETDEEIGQEQEQELDLPDTSGIVEDESTLDFSPETQIAAEDESGLDFSPETQTPAEDESGLDFGLEAQTLVEDEPEGDGLAETMEGKEDFDLSADSMDLSDDDFDLSEMEKILQEADSLEEEVAPSEPEKAAPPPLPEVEEAAAEEEPVEAQDDLDFGLDEEDMQEDIFQTEETQDIELEFGVEEGVEEEEKEEPLPVKPPEVKETAKIDDEDIEATYDMGIQLDELRKKQAAEKMKNPTAEEEIVPDKKAKPAKIRKPIPFEKKKASPVTVALLIIILIVGVPVALTNMGIKIPFVSDLDIKVPFADKIQQANIPYISDMVKSGEQDVQGSSKITILEPSINGYYLESEIVGVMFVISGRVRNDYGQLRNFISIKGQIYSKGKSNIESKTVYAGNILSEEELSTFNSAKIEKRLKNKYGNKRSNFKLNSGKAIPFMIVFTKIPDNLEGYDVEVAGSTLFQAKGSGK